MGARLDENAGLEKRLAQEMPVLTGITDLVTPNVANDTIARGRGASF